MTDSNLDDLDLRLQPIAKQFLVLCNEHFTTKITVTYRGSDEQDAAHAAGLSNALAGQSPHNCVDANGKPASKSFDWAIFESDGTYVTDGTDERYKNAGTVAKTLGLKWGGDFLHPDYDHAEMINWHSI